MKHLFLAACLALISLASAFSADEKEEPKLTLPQAKAKFEKADHALNDAWALVKKALAEGDFAQLREEQRGWVEWRDHMARAMGGIPADADGRKSSDYLDAAASLSEGRADWLRALAKGTKEFDDAMTGHWIDSYGGDLDIVEKEGEIYFLFTVVRGHGLNVGQIAGIAKWHSRIGWFSDKGRDKDKVDEANIAFVYRQPKLQVTEAGADYYHGHAAVFDGDYVKIKSLTAKEQKETLHAGQTGEVPGGR